jgi:hypothetical protein
MPVLEETGYTPKHEYAYGEMLRELRTSDCEAMVTRGPHSAAAMPRMARGDDPSIPPLVAVARLSSQAPFVYGRPKV